MLAPLSLAAALAIGCSGEVPAELPSESAPAKHAAENGAAENELIESYLAGRGFDTSDLQFEGDEVIVEGDTGMLRAVLLDAAQAEASGVVEKGYFNPGNALFSGKRITLSFGATVSPAWKTAYNAAAAEWNKQVPRFSQPGPGSAGVITVNKGRPNPPILNSSLAAAPLPPNRTITINENFSGAQACPGANIESLSATVKNNSALHEIGHILGFEHPPPHPTGGVRIAGTASSPNTGSTVAYSTVMDPGCAKTLIKLSSDDILSAQKKYPSCRTVCETNCLSQIDPGAIGLCIASCPQQCGG